MIAVGFDLDGTLIDSTDAIVESFFHTFRTLNHAVPAREVIVATISATLEEQFAMISNLDPKQAALVYREHYVRTAPSTTLLLPGVPESLVQLQTAGVRMGVATSKRRSSAEPILAHLNIARHFDACIGPEDVTHPKPHPEPLHTLMARMRVPEPSRFVYIGDTPYDAKAALAAGVPFVGVTTGYATREELADHGARTIVDTIADAANCVLNGCIRRS